MRIILFTLLAATPSSAVLAEPPARAQLKVSSTAFAANGDIPAEYTCEGVEHSPPLGWSGVPSEARSIAILVQDPDATNGTFTHWIVTGLPAATVGLAAGAALPEGAVAGKSDNGKAGWTGPCPPSGRHRYIFHVYALDIPLAKQLTRSDFVTAIAGHVVAQGELVGMYQKQRR